jgi:Ca2+-binding RTX toxin-like protein
MELLMAYPTFATTGVPAGVSLTQYTGPMTITKPGTVIEGKIINGTLTVLADNVTIRNSKIIDGGSWGIDADSRSITVEHCDIIGRGTTGNSGILGGGNLRYNNISGYENGIMFQGGGVIKGNYIHDLQASGADPHYDGIQIMGPLDGALIEDNTILARDTSNIFIANEWGAISNLVINRNYLGGTPGYAIYVEGIRSGGPVTNVTITNNHVEKGHWGYYSIEKASPNFSGNVELGPNGEGMPADPTPAPIQWETPATPDTPRTPEVPTVDVPTFSGSIGYGTNINDTLIGNELDNFISARRGDDLIKGGPGHDIIDGGAGHDETSGGVGRDVFDFSRLSDIKGDHIQDFERGIDKIRLSAIDANPNRSGNQEFTFNGYTTSDTSGQVWLTEDDAQGVTRVNGQVGSASFQIELKGPDLSLTEADFIL